MSASNPSHPPLPPAEENPKTGSRRTLWVAILVVVLLAAAGVIFWAVALNGKDSAPVPEQSGGVASTAPSTEPTPEQSTPTTDPTPTPVPSPTESTPDAAQAECVSGQVLPEGVNPIACGPIPATATEVPANFIWIDNKPVQAIVTPSGNIVCDHVSGRPLLCGIISLRDISGADMPKWVATADGSGELGFASEVAANADTEKIAAEAMQVPYGTVASMGDYACLSEESGLSCWNGKTGSGWKLDKTGISASW